MKNEEKLLLAIGEISDDIVSEALAPYERKSIPVKKVMAIAAGISLITVSVALLTRMFSVGLIKDAAGNAAAPEMNGGMSFDGSYSDCTDINGNYLGSLAYVGRVDENSFRFKLTLNSTAVVNLSFKSADGSIIYTTNDITAESIEIRSPMITVNGEAAEALPSLPGEYDIIISFEGMEDNIEWCDYITFDRFGRYFCFN